MAARNLAKARALASRRGSTGRGAAAESDAEWERCTVCASAEAAIRDVDAVRPSHGNSGRLQTHRTPRPKRARPAFAQERDGYSLDRVKACRKALEGGTYPFTVLQPRSTPDTGGGAREVRAAGKRCFWSRCHHSRDPRRRHEHYVRVGGSSGIWTIHDFDLGVYCLARGDRGVRHRQVRWWSIDRSECETSIRSMVVMRTARGKLATSTLAAGDHGYDKSGELLGSEGGIA